MARQAIAAARDDPWVLMLAGFALALLAGDNDAALSAIDRAIVLNPNFALAFGHRALVLAYLNRPDEAIRAAQQAIRLSPRDPTVFIVRSGDWRARTWRPAATRRGCRGPKRRCGKMPGCPALRLKLSLCGHLGRHRGGARLSEPRARE